MTRLLIFIFFLTSFRLTSQTTLTNDSFFLKQKSLPKEYKSIITDTRWLHIGLWQSNKNEIYTPDTIKTVHFVSLLDPMRSIQFTPHGEAYILKDTLSPFEMNIYYLEIKGRKIITGVDSSFQKIVYVDTSTLILESKNKKEIYRVLYRRRT
jgi:hypothetical protein